MKRIHSHPDLDSILLFFAFVLANLRATIFVFLHPDTSRLLGLAWIEIVLWVFLTLAVLYTLAQKGQLRDYLSMWRRNWLVACFVLFAFASYLWSVAPRDTLFSALELLLATLVAAYFGMRFEPERTMEALFWFGALLFILSIALAIGAPPTGTMYWRPFDGAWRGVYWHRNHLASITAFLSIVYLCRLAMAVKNRNAKGVLDFFFYLLSLLILYFARSATGYILFVVLHAALVVVWLWLRWEHRLYRRHYLLALLGSAVLAILVLANLDFVFSLFGRDSTMTGRVGLWSNLIDLALRRPWLGHGFGAVWTLDSFRAEIRQLAGWHSQPLIADNGWLDIYLHLGRIGLILFSSALILAAVWSLQYGIRQKTLPGFFPVLVMVYALFANITFSLFAETEVFVWFLIVMILFLPLSLVRKRLLRKLLLPFE